MAKTKRPVYLVIRLADPDKEDGPFTLIAIKQTFLAASQEAAKHEEVTVRKGFVTTD